MVYLCVECRAVVLLSTMLNKDYDMVGITETLV